MSIRIRKIKPHETVLVTSRFLGGNGRMKRNDDRGEELSICRRIESRIVYVERVGRIFDLPNRDGSEFQLTWLLIEQGKDKAKFKTISEKF